MKKISVLLAAATILASLASCKTVNKNQETEDPQSTVYVTRDLSSESLVNIYHKLGHPASGRVALKISTGESEAHGIIAVARSAVND